MNNQEYREMLPCFEGTELFDLPEGNKETPVDIKEENLHETLIISSKELDGPEQTLLKNILAALKLTENDVTINYLDTASTTFARLTQKFPIKRMVMFGVKPADLSLNILMFKNKVITLNRIKLIFTDDLTYLDNHKASKAELWEALQQMFKV